MAVAAVISAKAMWSLYQVIVIAIIEGKAITEGDITTGAFENLIMYKPHQLLVNPANSIFRSLRAHYWDLLLQVCSCYSAAAVVIHSLTYWNY